MSNEKMSEGLSRRETLALASAAAAASLFARGAQAQGAPKKGGVRGR